MYCPAGSQTKLKSTDMKSNKVTEQDTPNLMASLLWLLLHTVFTWIEHLLRLLGRCRKAIYHTQALGRTAIESIRIRHSQLYVKSQFLVISKIPTHLVVLLGSEQPDYQRLSQLICWSFAARIPYVSFYDHNGNIKRNHEQIKRYVDEVPLEAKHHIRWLDQNDKSFDARRVPFCWRYTFVSFLSPEDGKQRLVRLSRSIGQSVLRRDLIPSDLNIEFLDRCMQASSGYVPDPDLAVYFGEVCSTYGVLPWHIRLTEFLQLACRLEDSNEHQFVNCLLRFAKCEQRIGT